VSQPEENREKSAKTDAVLTPREVRRTPNLVPRPPAARPDRAAGSGGAAGDRGEDGPAGAGEEP
jgi:hypothetical protein